MTEKDPLGRVYRIGIEIEGGFVNRREGEAYHHDGSVDVSMGGDGYVGAVVSKPLSTLEKV